MFCTRTKDHMPQITQGIRSILSTPLVYSLFGQLVGARSGRRMFVQEYVKPNVGTRILDIGCGPGDIFEFLPSTEYLGFDVNQDYIQAAKSRFATQVNQKINPPTFICESVEASTLTQKSYFDIVLAIGILHHLDDQAASQLFELANIALKPRGRLITFDGVYIPNQSPVARWIISKDRGQNVRTEQEYVRLAKGTFSDLTAHIRCDLLNIPYTHIILECRK